MAKPPIGKSFLAVLTISVYYINGALGELGIFRQNRSLFLFRQQELSYPLKLFLSERSLLCCREKESDPRVGVLPLLYRPKRRPREK